MSAQITEQERARLFEVADGVIGVLAWESEPQAVLARVWGIEGQVNNGGFAQYFGSSDGGEAPRAAAALAMIGAPKMAAIVAKAVAEMGEDFPWADDGARQSRADELVERGSKTLNALDDEFIAYPDGDTERLLLDWIAAHPDDFASL